MKIKPKILFIILLISNSVFGQIEFDYHTLFNRILEQSTDSSSVFYYPKLLDRFNKNDSTLTNIEVIALQIGFTSNRNYKPYQTLDIERKIRNLVSDEKFEDAIKKSDSLLITNPLNFTALMEKGYSYMKLKKEKSEFHKGKFMKIVYSIMSSGKGTIEKPYFVLGSSDGGTLIKYILGGKIGIAGSQRDSNGYFCDMLEMINEKETKTLYFNINHATEKMFTKEEKEEIKKIELDLKKEKNNKYQNFSTEYRNKYRKTGKSDLPEVVKTMMKKEMNRNIEIYKSVFKKKGLEIDSLSCFSIVFENYKSGLVLRKKKPFSFQLDNNEILINNSFLKDYKRIDVTNPKSIIFHLIKKKEYEKLKKYAKKEISLFENGRQSKFEYEILIYDSNAEKKLRMIIVHEFITELYEK